MGEIINKLPSGDITAAPVMKWTIEVFLDKFGDIEINYEKKTIVIDKLKFFTFLEQFNKIGDKNVYKHK